MQDAPPEASSARGDAISLGQRIARFFGSFPIGVWIAAAALLGGTVGLAGFTFVHAEGFSYLSNDPQACVNCHVMRDVYDGWNRGTHKAVAVCNDCHTPHNSIIAKYGVKALNGFRHSYAFTTGAFPEPIRITPMDREITRHTCLYCHGELTAGISHAGTNDPTDCLTCHAGVGHGK